MASVLKKATAAIAATRTSVLTATAAKQTIIITGTVANTDSTNKATYFVTIEVQTGATYRVLVKDAPIPYGGALELPKVVMEAGDVLHMTGSAASVLEGYISYVEKD